MTSSTGSRIRLRSCADLLACVPYLLGFHPADSIVAVALRRGVIAFAARGDLPGPSLPAGAVAARFVALLVRERADAVLLVGYGAAARVTAAVDAVRDALVGTRLEVLDALRVEDGRYWSYICGDPSCCPPSGTPFDKTTAPAAAAAVFAGQVALTDREAVVRQIAPVTGPARMAMAAATRRAERRLGLLLDSSAAAPRGVRAPRSAAASRGDPAPSSGAARPPGLSGIRGRADLEAPDSTQQGMSGPKGPAGPSAGCGDAGVGDLRRDQAATAVSDDRVTSREAAGSEVGKVVSHELASLIGLGSSTPAGRMRPGTRRGLTGEMGGHARRSRALSLAGREAVDTAFARCERGENLTDDEVAWLAVLLTSVPVRDHAWVRMDADERQVRLWTDVLRRVDPELAAAPAGLLSFAAWQAGHGVLAVAAVERALHCEPDYTMALLMEQVLDQCLSPAEWERSIRRRRARRAGRRRRKRGGQSATRS
jgi:hypothetical protein